jgi:hypothetical protein
MDYFGKIVVTYLKQIKTILFFPLHVGYCLLVVLKFSISCGCASDKNSVNVIPLGITVTCKFTVIKSVEFLLRVVFALS